MRRTRREAGRGDGAPRPPPCSCKLTDTRKEYYRCGARAAGVACETVQIEQDHPYEGIIETAERRGCDLIVMASHGRSGIAAIVLGSVTTKVLTHTKIPVLVCH